MNTSIASPPARPLDTDVLLPGHWPVWRGPIREAVELATA